MVSLVQLASALFCFSATQALGIRDTSSIQSVLGNTQLKTCKANQDQAFQIRKLIVDPPTLTRGETVKVQAEVALTEPITDGAKVKVHAKFNDAVILQQEVDICKNMQRAKKSCPVNPTSASFAFDYVVPTGIPAGTFNFEIDSINGDKLLSCHQGVLTIN